MSRTYKDKPWKFWTEADDRANYVCASHFSVYDGYHSYWSYGRFNGGCICDGANVTRVRPCRCLEPCECRATVEARLDYDCRHRAWPAYRYVKWAPVNSIL